MKRWISLLLCICLAVSVLPLAAAADLPFKDVAKSDWFYSDVQRAYELELINGKSATSFAPNDNLTVAEAVKLAACMNQKSIQGFVSLTNGNPWYATYVTYCKNTGIITRDYDWNKPATRAEYMDIFSRALGSSAYQQINYVPDGSIPDVPVTHPQAAAIYALYRAGIVQGSAGTYNGVQADHLCKPNDNIRRSEVAAILVRMMSAASRITFSMGVAAPLTVRLDRSATLRVEVNAEFAVNASVTGGTAPYTYQWQIASTATGTYSAVSGATNAKLSAKFPAAGTWYLRCVVTDAAGQRQESAVLPVVIGSDLSVKLDKTGTIYVDRNTNFTVKATPAGGTAPYTYKWEYSINAGGSWSALSSVTDTLVFPCTTVGNYTLRCTVTDKNGKTASASVLVSVSTLTITLNRGTTALKAGEILYLKTGETVDLAPAATGGTAPYTYRWAISGGNAYDLGLDRIRFSSSLAGTYTVTCTVTDKNGATSSATCYVTVSTASDLTVALNKTGTQNVAQGSSFDVRATVSGGIAPYTYKWEYLYTGSTAGTETFTQYSSSLTASDITFPCTYTGTCTLRCIVTDSTGRTAYSTVTLNIRQSALTVTLSKTVTQNVAQGSSFDVRATVSGGVAPYTYKWEYAYTGGSANTFSQNTSYSAYSDVTFPCNTAGTCSLRCTVTDSTGKTASSAIVTLNISASAGDLTVRLSESRHQMTVGETFDLYVSSVPDGSGSYDLDWRFTPSGNASGVPAGNGHYNFTPRAAGTYTITCNVTDRSTGRTGKATCEVTVTAGGPITALSVTLDKTYVEVPVGGTLTVTATATGGTQPYTYSWQTNSFTGWVDFASGQTLNYSNFNQAGATYTIRCVVNGDEDHPSPTLTVKVVEAGSGDNPGTNPPDVDPEVTVTIPQGMVAGETYTFTASGTKPDGTFEYYWFIDPPAGTLSPATANGTGSTYLYTATAGEHTVVCWLASASSNKKDNDSKTFTVDSEATPDPNPTNP